MAVSGVELASGQDILTHGVSRRNRLETPLDAHVERLWRLGYTVLPNVLAASELEHARSQIDDVYRRQVEEIGGLEALKSIHDANVVRSLLVYDDFFLHRIAANPEVIALVQALLGENVSLSSQVGIINEPSDEIYQAAWHRELQYQHFVSSKPLALQSLVCIDDFTEATGATLMLPYSHAFEDFPSDDFVRANMVQLCAPAGSILVFNSMVYHRSGVNVSRSVRRGINNLYTLPIIQQQINFAKMLGGKHSDDPFLRKLLGYEWGVADSVLAWRRERLRRTQA